MRPRQATGQFNTHRALGTRSEKKNDSAEWKNGRDFFAAAIHIVGDSPKNSLRGSLSERRKFHSFQLIVFNHLLHKHNSQVVAVVVAAAA